MSPNRQNFTLYKEITVGESNVDVRIYTGSSQIAISVHAQRKDSWKSPLGNATV